MSKREVRLIENWLPINPETEYYKKLSKEANKNKFNKKKYKNIVQEMTREDTVNKAKRIVPTRKVNPLNLSGIKDDRKDKGKKFKIGVK